VKKVIGFYPCPDIDTTATTVVSNAGTLLLAETIGKVGLDRALSAALEPWRPRLAVHDPAKVLLDLALRAPDDRVVHPALDEEETLLVQPAVVPGEEEPPSIHHRAPARVLAGHLVTADPDLAAAPRREHRPGAVPDLQLDAGNRQTRGGQPGAAGPVPRGQRGAVLVGPQHGDGRAGLGQAVGVDEIDLGPHPQGALDDRQRHLGAAIGQGLPRAASTGRGGAGPEAAPHRRPPTGAATATAQRPDTPRHVRSTRGPRPNPVSDLVDHLHRPRQPGEQLAMVRGEPPLEQLPGRPVQPTGDHRSRVHIHAALVRLRSTGDLHAVQTCATQA